MQRSWGSLEQAMDAEGVHAGNRARLIARLESTQRSGIDPRKFPFVVDFVGSKTILTFDCFNTITATRAMSRDYWSTELNRRFILQELQEAQGSKSDKYDTSMMSDREYGRMIGSAMSVPVFADILKEIIKALGK